MNRSSFVEYAHRSRSELESSKREHWARQYKLHGSVATLAAARALWHHMRKVRPDWPTAADQAADLAHQIELKRLIDKAGHAIAPRRPAP